MTDAPTLDRISLLFEKRAEAFLEHGRKEHQVVRAQDATQAARREELRDASIRVMQKTSSDNFYAAAEAALARVGSNEYLVKMAFNQEREKIAFVGNMVRGVGKFFGKRRTTQALRTQGAREVTEQLGKRVQSITPSSPKGMFSHMQKKPGFMDKMKGEYAAGYAAGGAKALGQDASQMAAARGARKGQEAMFHAKPKPRPKVDPPARPPKPDPAAQPNPQAAQPNPQAAQPQQPAAGAAQPNPAAGQPVQPVQNPATPAGNPEQGWLGRNFGWGQQSPGLPQNPTITQRAGGWFNSLNDAQLRNNALLAGAGVGAAGVAAGSALGGQNRTTVVYR